jgi:hypothetical protein
MSGLVGQAFFNPKDFERIEERATYRQSGFMHSNYFANDDQIPRYQFEDYSDDQEKQSLEVLKDHVNKYLDNYEAELIISDIFIFEDSEYYFSISEEETDMGAMELLVNPYSGAVYPKYGPNMMWNLKYGMHSNGGRMSSRGMMGFNHFNYDDESYDESYTNEISPEEAYDYGLEYLENNMEDLTLDNIYHEFYGYYTYHVMQNNQVVGTLSVHGSTGQIWYKGWHGHLIDVISDYD